MSDGIDTFISKLDQRMSRYAWLCAAEWRKIPNHHSTQVTHYLFDKYV